MTLGEGVDDERRKAERSGEVSNAGTYVPGLDGLRALAVAWVFLLHLDRPHFPGGAIGVDVFFVLSAYLITGQLLVRSGEPSQFTNFYWRRAFRLFPALLLFIVFIGTPTAISAHEVSKLPISIAGSLFYINDFLQAYTHSIAAAFDQTWSLAVEEQFYIIWPAVLLLVLCRWRPRVQALGMAALVLLGLILLFHGGNYFLPTGHLFALALGCAAAWARFNGWQLALPQFVPWIALGLLGVSVVIHVHLRPTLSSDYAALLNLAAVALVIGLDTSRRSVMSRWFGSSALVWVGARSYAVYLYGLTMIQLLGNTTGLTLHYVAPLSIAATTLLVAASYRWVESPIRRGGRAWLDRRNNARLLENPAIS